MANATNTTAAPFPLYTPSIIKLNVVDQFYVDNANILIAPWVMGAFADMFLQGILVVQTSNYFNFREPGASRNRFTLLVVFLCILCLLKSAQNILIVWDTVIVAFANPQLSLAMTSTLWTHSSTGLSTAIIAIVVQSFFVYRYWMLTRKWYVCAVMLSGMTVSLVAAILAVVYVRPFDDTLVMKWSIVHFITAIIVDVLITAGTVWHLQGQQSSVKSTRETIDRLVRMTWQSALPPTVCVIVNAILAETHKRDLIQLAVNAVLPKLYTISLMYTLNIRNQMLGEKTSYECSASKHAHAVSLGAGRSSMPTASAYSRHDGNGGTTMGSIEAGDGMPAEKPGVQFIGGGKRRTLRISGLHDATGKRIDGIHVETHISRDGVVSSENTMELQSFHGDEIKVQRNSESDREVCAQDQKCNSQ